jgi:hypothetical protein
VCGVALSVAVLGTSGCEDESFKKTVVTEPDDGGADDAADAQKDALVDPPADARADSNGDPDANDGAVSDATRE